LNLDTEVHEMQLWNQLSCKCKTSLDKQLHFIRSFHLHHLSFFSSLCVISQPKVLAVLSYGQRALKLMYVERRIAQFVLRLQCAVERSLDERQRVKIYVACLFLMLIDSLTAFTRFTLTVLRLNACLRLYGMKSRL
jgi:hypothetical protein